MLNLKNHFFSVLLLCTPIIIISSDKPSDPDHYETFKKNCSDQIDLDNNKVKINRNTMQYGKPFCTTKSCSFSLDKESVPLEQLDYCTVDAQAIDGSNFVFWILITYNKTTSKINDTQMLRWSRQYKSSQGQPT